MTSTRWTAPVAVLIVVVAGGAPIAVPRVASSPAASAQDRPSASRCPNWKRARPWTPARPVSARGRQFSSAALAVAPSGEAIAAWGDQPTVAFRPAGGRFGRPRSFGGRAISAGPLVDFASDRPVAVWSDGQRLHVALGARDGTPFSHRAIATERDPAFALSGGAGRPGLLVWSTAQGTVAADLAQGRLGTPAPLPATGRPASAATDARGGATVTLVSFTGPSPTLRVVERSASDAFRVSHELARPDTPTIGGSVRDKRGGAALIWTETGPASPRPVVMAMSRRPSGQFGTPQQLSTPGADPTALSHASDRDGYSLAAWGETNGRSSRLMLATRRAGGDWRARIVREGLRPLHNPDVAVSGSGRAAVLFSLACGSRAALLGVRRNAARTWQAPEVVASWTGYLPRSHSVGFGARGALTALWTQRPRTGGGLREIPVVAATRPP